jgi:hypothetical protein
VRLNENRQAWCSGDVGQRAVMEWAQLVNDPPLLAIAIAIKLLEGANPSSHTVPCEPPDFVLMCLVWLCRLVPCLCGVTSLLLPLASLVDEALSILGQGLPLAFAVSGHGHALASRACCFLPCLRWLV